MLSREKTESPLVSVIINCYNGQQYLSKAIESVYSQTYQNWEIIFWDNNSSDHSATIAKRFSSKLKYFSSDKTVPLYAARNHAIKRCSGKYITFLDCDDLWHPGKIEKQVATIEPENTDMLYTAYMQIDKRDKIIKKNHVPHRAKVTARQLLDNYNIAVGSVMVKRDLFSRHLLLFHEKLNYAGDYCLFITIASRFQVVSICDYMFYYRVHSGSVTSTMSLQKRIDEYSLIEDTWGKSLSGDDFRRAANELRYRKDLLGIKLAIHKNDIWFVKKMSGEHALRNHKVFVMYLLCWMPKTIRNFAFRRLRSRESTC